MRDRIVDHIRRNSGNITSPQLAELFLKFKAPDPALAHRAIAAVLSGDRRCRMGDDGRWHAAAASRSADAPLLRQLPWAAVYVVAGRESSEIYHVAVWSVYPRPRELYSAWLKDPAALTPEERIIVAGAEDAAQTPKPSAEVAAAVATALEARIPVYAASRQQSLCAWLCAREKEALNDDAFVLSRLMRAAGCAASSAPGDLSLETSHDTILGYAPSSKPLCDQAGVLAACVAGALDLCARNGIETRDALDEAAMREIAPGQFAGKAFTLQHIAALPPLPGVYAFTRADGSYLYIGKSTNLRQRVLGYFKPSDALSRKLERLRAESHGLIAHRCGSELESLIYEYRLIRKHQPTLNTQRQIYERKGTYRPVDDCIILLPHADGAKGMSFWFRRNQKIAVKPFDPAAINELADELQAFFFNGTLPPSPEDFPEQEIATRWIKRHQDDLIIVPVHALAGPEEAVEAMRSAWMEAGR